VTVDSCRQRKSSITRGEKRISENHFDVLSEEASKKILGINRAVPLSPDMMAKDLQVTFYPIFSASERVRNFAQKLHHALAECGANIVEYEQALSDPRSGKLKEGIVVIAPGELREGDLPVDHVSDLRTTTIVGVTDGPCPVYLESTSQEKLNSIAKTLAWSLLQVAIFVDDDSWTICTMNGAIIRCRNDGSLKQDVFSTLVPKLAAPVVPPHSADFEVHEGKLDLSSKRYEPYIRDFIESGGLWAQTGLMLFHTSLDSLSFRNKFYKRIAAAFVDHRSGMSYGFLARQLPTPAKPSFTVPEADRILGRHDWNTETSQRVDDSLFAALNVNGETLITEVPDVWVLTTRSGCNKSKIDPRRDIVMMGLSKGNIVFETPKGVSTKIDCKPSYDTVTILSHALGNSLIASVLGKLNPRALFATTFRENGMALAHWHGQVDRAILPKGYFIHGGSNPPVSCSTHQAAMYALTGKISTLGRSLDQRIDFLGDVHIEPHHGTNITGVSLVALARWVLQNIESITGLQSGVEALVEG